MMNSRKNKFISGLLSFVMVMTMVLEILPPIEAGAAAPKSTFPDESETMYIGDEYTFSGKATANGSNITVVRVGIYTPASNSSEDTGYTTDKGGYWYENERLNTSSFSYGSYIESFTWGEVLNGAREGTTIDTSQPGKYYVTVWTKAADGEAVRCTHTIYLEEKDTTDPEINYIESSHGNSFSHGEYPAFECDISDDVELDKIKIYFDGTLVEEEDLSESHKNITYYSSTMDDSDYEDFFSYGDHTFKIRVYDTSDNYTTDTYDYTVIDDREPYISFKVSPTTVTEGEKITFSGIADGDGYKINAVSIGVAYYESEEKYYEEQNKDDPSADDAVYLREPNISVDTFDYSSIKDGSIPTGSDKPLEGEIYVEGEYVPHEILMKPGVYTFTAHAYSDEYGKEFEQVSKTVRIEPDEEIQEEIQLDSFKITNTNTTVNRGSSYMLEWDAPANAPAGTTYSIFVWEYSTTTEVGSTTDLRFEIPSKCFANAEVVAITVYANADGYKQSECEETLNVTVIEDDTKTPCVTSVVPDPPAGDMNTTYTFTAYAENTDTVVFYMNSTKIATVTGSNGEFVCSYSGFRKAGTRTVFAYPIDSNGNEIRTEGCYASAEITIEAEGNLENIKYITESYQNIDVNSSFELAWERPENAPEDIDISYIIYVHNDDGKVGDEFEESGESTVIPASYFAEEGRYTISVYAVADNWSQSEYSAITVYVEASVPTISGYRLSHTTIPRDGSFTMKGTVDGNGDNLTEILVKAVNTSSGTSVELYSESLNDREFDLADIPALCPSNSGLTEAGTYTISVYAKTVGATSATLLGKSSLYVSADSKIILDTPQLNGTSTLEYGENYIISWNYDSAVDYYTISVRGYPTKMTANASEGSYSIPASIFKNLSSGSSYNCTIYVQAMSKDTDNYLSSATAEKKITVAAKSEATAIIKSAEIVGLSADKVIIGGSDVEFKVVTSKDVTALRMKDGTGSFIINTWTTGYTDSGDDRIWKVTQKVNYAGGSDVSGAKRMLTFYSMIGETEYNTYNISFYCQKGDTIGTFSVLTPKNESVHDEGKSLRITWSKPQNTEVDRYILEVVHNGQTVVREEVEGKCEYTLDGSYLVRDNNAWKIQVTARKDAGQWSESSAFASFTLNCTHEKRNPSSERVLSYTFTGSTVEHSAVVEITSVCEDCGIEIADKKRETRIEGHNFVKLDQGGKVCNRCWFMIEDGTFTDTTECIANAKANACTNVGSDGKPYGVQYVNGDVSNVRKVFAGDKVTILGKLNGCCLIQYPISGGYWYGFVEESVLDKKKQVVDKISIEEQIVDEYFKKYKETERELSLDLSCEEFVVAQYIASSAQETMANSWFNNIHQKFSYDWRTGGKLALGNIISVFSEDLKNNLYDSAMKQLAYEILYAVCENMPVQEQYEYDLNANSTAQELTELCEFLKGCNDSVSNFSDIESYLSDDIIEELNTITKTTAHIRTVATGALVNCTASVVAEIIDLMVLQIQCNVMTFEVLKDSFGEDAVYAAAVDELKYEYLHKNVSILKTLGESLIQEGLELTISAACPPLGIIMKTLDIIDFIKFTFFGNVSEVMSDLSVATILYDCVQMQYNTYLSEYARTKNNKNVLAKKIIELYRVKQGYQILMNRLAKDITKDPLTIEILESEIQHLNQTPIEKWKINPNFSRGEIDKPKMEFTYYSEVYEKLLTGYNANSLIGSWDDKYPHQQYRAKMIIDLLKQFSDTTINSVAFIEMRENQYTLSVEPAIIFINEEGMGLLVCYLYDSKAWINEHMAYSVLTKEQLEKILSNNSQAIDINICYSEVHMVQQYSYPYDVFYNAHIFIKELSVTRYFEKEVTENEYLVMFEEILKQKNYTRAHRHYVFDKMIANAFDIWVFESEDMAYWAKKMGASLINTKLYRKNN